MADSKEDKAKAEAARTKAEAERREVERARATATPPKPGLSPAVRPAVQGGAAISGLIGEEQANQVRPVASDSRAWADAQKTVNPADRLPQPTEADLGTESDPESPDPEPRSAMLPPSRVPTVREGEFTEPVPADEGVVTSGTFRLLEPHYWVGDLLLPAETLVGDGTDYPLYEGFKPSLRMVEADTPSTQKPKGLPGQGGRSR